jgi:hypothetical protein
VSIKIVKLGDRFSLLLDRNHVFPAFWNTARRLGIRTRGGKILFRAGWGFSNAGGQASKLAPSLNRQEALTIQLTISAISLAISSALSLDSTFFHFLKEGG